MKCDLCGKPAKYSCSRQFVGNFNVCEFCAKHDADFMTPLNDYMPIISTEAKLMAKYIVAKKKYSKGKISFEQFHTEVNKLKQYHKGIK